MTHDELVKAAVKWLKAGARYEDHQGKPSCPCRCSVVFAEMVSSAFETPDAIGFYGSGQTSFLVECKASHSDFKADAKKPFRMRPEFGAGDYRYFLAPSGLLDPSEVPELWGLIESTGKKTEITKLAKRHKEKRQTTEINLLWSAVRRLKTNDAKQRKPIC